MDLDQEFSAQDIGQGFEFQIMLGHLRVLVATLHFGVVLFPFTHVVLRLNEGLTLYLKVAHAGRRELLARAIDAFGIFTAGELDGFRRAGKQHCIPSGTVLVLDHHRLATNHVGGAVQ